MTGTPVQGLFGEDSLEVFAVVYRRKTTASVFLNFTPFKGTAHSKMKIHPEPHH